MKQIFLFSAFVTLAAAAASAGTCPAVIEADCTSKTVRTYVVGSVCQSDHVAYIESMRSAPISFPVRRTNASGLGTPNEKPLRWVKNISTPIAYELEIYLTNQPTPIGKPIVRTGTLSLSGSQYELKCTLYPTIR